MQQTLHILIVEDDAIIASLIEHHLTTAAHKVVGIAHHGDMALSMIASQSPDLILLDINIEGERDGIDIAMIIKESHDIPVIFLTALSDPETLSRAAVAEPCAYIVKPYKESDLHTSIWIGLHNYTNRKNSSFISLADINTVALDVVTDKEYEVIQDVVKGLTNTQIAQKQFLSISTIKWHLQNIYSKLDVTNRTSLVQKVYSSKH